MRMTSRIPILNSYTRRDVAHMAILYAMYVATALIGSSLFTAPAVVFPAAAIALAALVLGGIHLWPAIVAASLTGNFFSGAPFDTALFLSAAHGMHAAAGAYALRFLGFDPVFRRIRDMFAYMFVAFIAAAIVPSIGFLSLYLNGGLSNAIGVTWFSWWVGIFLTDLIFGSVLIRWFAKRDFTRTRKEVLEILSAFLVLIGTSYILYWTDTTQSGGASYILLYLLPLVWFVLRLGMRFTLLAFAVTSVIGITGILYGFRPENISLGLRLLTTEIFLATLAVIFFLFVSVMEERARASRQLTAQLHRVRGLLQKVQAEDQAKNEFLAIFSHELRNPLAPIVSSLELLKLRGGDAETQQIIDVVDDRVRTIVRLLDDLLDISRISQKKFQLRRERIDVRTIVEKTIRSCKETAKKRGIDLDAFIPASPLLLDADPVRIEQMLLNLISNAMKYTDSGGRVSVRVAAEDGDAVISVHDTGIGISRDMLKRIFEPFLQLEHRERTVNEGLGIGLSLTEKLVLMHGGSIEARSEGIGTGSEFIVRLPLAETPTDLPTSSPVPLLMEKTIAQPHSVLVVDDNVSAAQALGKLLELQGHRVAYGGNGKEALEKTREFSPEVVVLDIGLPDVSGYEVAEKLRNDMGFRGTLVALTGYGQEEDKQRARDAGFDHHLTKPIGLAQLRAVLPA